MTQLTISQNFLDHAKEQGIKKGLYDFPIVDADCHYIMTPLEELADFVEEPWKQRFKYASMGANLTTFPTDLGDRTIAGRTKVREYYRTMPMPKEETMPKTAYPLVKSLGPLAIDYAVVFPTDLLNFGLHPDSDMEVAIAFGYAGWMTERVLPADPSLKTMLYLPFSNPEACVRLVKEYGDKPGVVGCLVTSVRYNPVHHNAYMPLYKLLEEKGLPLGFHTAAHWQELPFRQLNTFLASHALGFPFYNMVQLTNLVINGIPERFPDLKIIMIEAGVAWIPFIMRRLDLDYSLRPSEAPLLKKKPSEYIKNFYFTTQPLENYENMEEMKMVFDIFDAENQLLYASDYPHQDFDTPSTIYDLPFLSEKAKRKILGENALKLFNIKEPKLWARRALGEQVE